MRLDRTGASGSPFWRFLAEFGNARPRRSKAGPRRSKPVELYEQVLKNIEKGRGGSVFGPHRREPIAFSGEFGDARLGRLEQGLGRKQKSPMGFKKGGDICIYVHAE